MGRDICNLLHLAGTGKLNCFVYLCRISDLPMEISKSKKTALLFGATGLVGGYCLEYLLDHPAYREVRVFGRRKLNLTHDKLQQYIVDFDLLQDHAREMEGADVFICLGTTMRKAGGREAFYKVDFTYAYESARIAAENGANQLLLVSSVGANKESLFFYSRVKGQLENAVQELPFWSIHVFRPSVLLGERNENRWGEELAGQLGRGFDRLTGGLLSKYRPIEAEVVAKAMVNAAQHLKEGVHIYPSDYLQQLAAEADANREVRRG